MSSPSNHPYLNHLLNRVLSDLEFLSRERLINRQDFDLIKSKLELVQDRVEPPNRGVASNRVGGGGLEDHLNQLQLESSNFGGVNQSGGGAAVTTHSATTLVPTSTSISTSKGQCKAVWNYSKSQADDLGFQAGDIIDIVEEVNADWWKGSLRGETGLFPSNHVERIQSRAPPPRPPPHAAPYNVNYSQPPSTFSPPPPPSHYGNPQSQQPYAYQQPQGYSHHPFGGPGEEKQPPQPYYNPNPPINNNNIMVPSSSSTGSAAALEEEKKKKKFPGGQFGKTVGTAFAGGMGFGAGSAITSNAINAIF